MDGRKSRFFPGILALSVIGLACAGGLPVAHGEAMSKAAVDVLAVGPAVAPAAPIATNHATPPVHPTAPVAGTGATAATLAPKAPQDEPPAVTTQPAATMAAASVTTAKPPEAAPASPLEQASIRARTEQLPGDGETNKPQRSPLINGLYSTLQVGGALAIVIGLIIIGRAMMRRFVPGASVGNGKGVIETLARYPIGRNQSVVLLRIGSQIVALNQTKDASQSILVINEPVEVAKIIGQIEGQDSNSIQTNFNRALANARMDLEAPDTMDVLDANRSVTTAGEEDLDQQLEEMAAAKRQLMELRAQVRSVRDNLPA